MKSQRCVTEMTFRVKKIQVDWMTTYVMYGVGHRIKKYENTFAKDENKKLTLKNYAKISWYAWYVCEIDQMFVHVSTRTKKSFS
jgi:hypothetical protein